MINNFNTIGVYKQAALLFWGVYMWFINLIFRFAWNWYRWLLPFPLRKTVNGKQNIRNQSKTKQNKKKKKKKKKKQETEKK